MSIHGASKNIMENNEKTVPNSGYHTGANKWMVPSKWGQ